MKYFLPDSQDLVDPSFDFTTERRSRTRLRQRDDLYAHEIFSERAFDGFLVSKGIVDGFGAANGRYTLAQRQRLLRGGAHAFLRGNQKDGERIPVIGDCGAFTYVKEELPPYTVDEVVEFYTECLFDYGISVDHVILAYDAAMDETGDVPSEFRTRQEITIDLASKFKKLAAKQKAPFTPMGVAQGWSPKSYAAAVKALQKQGYDYIAVGGMVPLKTAEIIEILQAIDGVRKPTTKLHLLGVTRVEQVKTFAFLGVTSFDSTSPLRQAFKDDRDNFYTLDRTYVAIRIPQVEGNAFFQKRISSGQVSQSTAMRLERAALKAMADFDAERAKLDSVLNAVLEYERLFHQGRVGRDHTEVYRQTLEAAPWRSCKCDVCQDLGHHVILFRGAERNRRRGFHNVWTFYRRLQRDIARSSRTTTKTRRASAAAQTGAEP